MSGHLEPRINCGNIWIMVKYAKALDDQPAKTV